MKGGLTCQGAQILGGLRSSTPAAESWPVIRVQGSLSLVPLKLRFDFVPKFVVKKLKVKRGHKFVQSNGNWSRSCPGLAL
jgi:hypothetical protein